MRIFTTKVYLCDGKKVKTFDVKCEYTVDFCGCFAWAYARWILRKKKCREKRKIYIENVEKEFIS